MMNSKLFIAAFSGDGKERKDFYVSCCKVDVTSRSLQLSILNVFLRI